MIIFTICSVLNILYEIKSDLLTNACSMHFMRKPTNLVLEVLNTSKSEQKLNMLKELCWHKKDVGPVALNWQGKAFFCCYKWLSGNIQKCSPYFSFLCSSISTLGWKVSPGWPQYWSTGHIQFVNWKSEKCYFIFKQAWCLK